METDYNIEFRIFPGVDTDREKEFTQYFPGWTPILISSHAEFSGYGTNYNDEFK